MQEQKEITVEEMSIHCLDNQLFAYVRPEADKKEWPVEIDFCGALHVFDYEILLPTKFYGEYSKVARYLKKED